MKKSANLCWASSRVRW